MRIVRVLTVILFGLAMAAGYFGLLMAISQVTNTYFPAFGLPVFLVIGFALALLFMKLQTQLERMFIRRHVKRHPESTWRYTT